MEENSDIHMETDVTSTTDNAVDTQEVTGSNGEVEMTITVEKVNEEEPTSNMEIDGQTETSNNFSRSSISENNSPQKEQGNHSIKSPCKSEIVKLTKSPVKTESPQKVTIISPVKAITQMSSPSNMAENTVSSTKTATLVFPNKDRNKPNEKSSDSDKNLVIQSSPPALKKTVIIIKKTPVKDCKSEKTPVKVTEPEPYAHLVEVKDMPKEKNPAAEPLEEKTQVFQRSPSIIKSRPIKLVRRQPSKDVKIQEKEITANDTSTKPTEVSETPVTEESIDDNSKKSQDLAQLSTSNDVTEKTAVLENDNMNGKTSLEVSPKEILPEIEKPVALARVDVPMDATEAEASNDSQLSSSILTFCNDKEHNKSISRELKSLINSAKESKIISECTQLTSKTRKSRTIQDTSLNASVELESMQDDRKDPLACDADKPSLKRSMRSQNPDFVTKCKQFLNSVTSKVMKDSDDTQSDSETEEHKQNQKPEPLIQQSENAETSPKKKKIEDPVNANMLRADPFCWRCHWQLETEPTEKQSVHPPMHCTVCVRSYHSKCMTLVERKLSSEKNWVCPDCLQILHAESSESRSPAMKKISLGMLCDLLKYALERMEALNGVEPFLKPVDRTAFPDYDKVVVHPMDLSQMRQNIVDGHYGSTEAFIADAQWILHNSILFNACEQKFPHSKLTQAARSLVRTCRAEMTEIETCPECYAGAHSRNLTYFTDVCSIPHMILWAKLKGFPYWPAKAVAVNNGLVDVRFFGQHDKSWVPVRDCYLYSEKDPNTTKHKKMELMQCRQEAELHIRNICRKYGTFVYAPFKTTFDHTKMTEQLKMMIPSFEGEIKVTDTKVLPVIKDNRRSTSKSSYNDDDTSECDDASTTSSQKASNEDELTSTVLQKTPDESCTKPSVSQELSKEESTTVPAAKTKEEPKDKPVRVASTVEKDKPMETDVAQTKEAETPSRKRRRSTFPDTAVAESTAAPKKKKPEEIKSEPGPSTKDDKKETEQANKKPQTEAAKAPKSEKTKETQNTETGSSEKDKTKHSDRSLKEKEDPKRVTPIKLVALPRIDNQTPKLFTTAKVTKSTPSTPTTPSTPNSLADEENASTASSSSSKRSKVTKADKYVINLSGDSFKVRRSRRNSRSNKPITSTPNEKDKSNRSMNKSVEKSIDKKRDISIDKSVDKTADKKPNSGGEASTSKEKPSKKKDSARSLLKKEDAPKTVKGEPGKKSDDDVSLAKIARDNRISNTGLPTISNVVSLSTIAEKTNSTTTKTTTNAINTTLNTKATLSTSKTLEMTIEANPDSSIFTPTSSGNIGNMKEALSKLQKLRNETTTTESLVGRVGVKAFARMTSPDLHDEIEVKTEPIDLDEVDEERQMEKMDLMNACRLQPVNQTQSLREVRINKLIVNPVVITKSGGKANEPRTRAKKSFPQPKKPETGSELNGKNSMVYIPIQPPNTQPPTQQAITQPPKKQGTSNALGPRPNVPTVSTSIVNTVTTPLRPTSTLSSPSNANTSPMTLPQVSSGISPIPNIAQGSNNLQTVGPTAVHTVPLMTSVNGQWMFSLQPVMSVGRMDVNSPPPTVNGIPERTGSTQASASSANTMAPPSMPVVHRNQSSVGSPTSSDNTTPEMPRLFQRPLMNPFDVNTPIGSFPPPSTAGPLTAKLNQNAVKLTDFFRTLLEDSIDKLDEPHTQITSLKVQLEQLRWRNQQNLDEIKHNHELTVSEMRQSFEKEKLRIISETRRAAQVELEAAVKLTKSKQWCSNCYQEAQFYCCWNTSYCDHSCQRAHWNTHVSKCTQQQSFRQLLQRNLTQSAKVLDNNGNTVTSVTSVTTATSATSVTSVTPLITTPQVRRAEQSRTLMLPPSIIPREGPGSVKIIPVDLEEANKHQTMPMAKSNQSIQVEIDPSQGSKRGTRSLLKAQLPNWDHMEMPAPTERCETTDTPQASNSSDKDAPESRLQNSDNPPVLQKSASTPTPCLTTAGGKPAPMRVFTDSSGTQKTSIIVSMIDDPSGTQKVKCVGTYKAPAGTKSPLLINKQKTDDSAAKKTVTSGGYLIVGASGSNTSVITPASAARRSHVQYFS